MIALFFFTNLFLEAGTPHKYINGIISAPTSRFVDNFADFYFIINIVEFHKPVPPYRLILTHWGKKNLLESIVEKCKIAQNGDGLKMVY